MLIDYYFGNEDTADLFQIKCTKDMVLDCARDSLATMSHSELMEFIIDNIPYTELFELFYDALHDDYENTAYEIWKEQRL